MEYKELENLMRNSKDIKVPSDLLGKIKKSVAIRAKMLEKRAIIISSVKVGLALAALIYFLTGTLINLMNSDVSSYIAGLEENPYLLLTYDGLNAFLEQLPLLTLVVSVGALIYILFSKGIIKNLKNYPGLYGRVMAGFTAIFLTLGLSSGLALASTTNPNVNDFSTTKIFKPFLKEKTKNDFSSVGTIENVVDAEDGSVEVTISLSDGEEKTVELKKNNKRFNKGQKLFIVHEKKNKSEKRKLKGDFVKIL